MQGIIELLEANSLNIHSDEIFSVDFEFLDNWDSMMFMGLIMELELETGYKLEIKKLQECKNISDILEMFSITKMHLRKALK